MKVLRRANEPAPWAHTVACHRCLASLEVGAADLCHCAVDVKPFSITCVDCDAIIALATSEIPADVQLFVAGRAAIFRRSPSGPGDAP